MTEDNNSTNSLKDLLAAAVAAMAVVLIFERVSRASKPGRANPKAASDDGQESTTPNKSDPEAESSISKSETNCQAENFHPQTYSKVGAKIDWWSRWIGVGTLVAALIAACIYARQLTVMEGQLDEMQSEQRAWVSLSKDSGVESLYVDNMNELRNSTRFSLQNTGKNPATAVFVNAEMSIGDALSDGSMAAWQSAICGQPTGSLGMTMFPGSPEPIFTLDSGLTKAELARRKTVDSNTVVAPVVAACVVYEDAVTKKKHHTPVAYEIRMRAPRPGRGCCGIIYSDLPLKEDEIVLRPWVRGNLAPD